MVGAAVVHPHEGDTVIIYTRADTTAEYAQRMRDDAKRIIAEQVGHQDFAVLVVASL